MSKRKPQPKPILSRADLLIVRLSLFVALGISLFLAWTAFQGGAVPGCGPESDCDRVLSSRWAYLFGQPVSLFAAPIYAALLGFTWLPNLNWKLITALSVVVLLAACWFVGIQFFLLRAFCKFCLTAHAAGVVAAVLLLMRNPLAFSPTVAWSTVGTAAAAGLMLAQVTGSAPKPSALVYEPSSVATNAPGGAKAVPTFTTVANQFTLKLDEVPVVGRLDAPKKVAKLFDYTCHHCRDLHHHFKPLLQKYGEQLAVISLPMPLDSTCNHLMTRTQSAHVNACEYAKLGLAVFLAAPEKAHTFDDWILAPPRPPGVEESRRFARELVGAEALERALTNPRVAQQIRQDVEIYAANRRLAGGKGQMPQLLFAEGSSIGAVGSPEELERILVNALRLTNAAPKL